MKRKERIYIFKHWRELNVILKKGQTVKSVKMALIKDQNAKGYICARVSTDRWKPLFTPPVTTVSCMVAYAGKRIAPVLQETSEALKKL